MLSIWRGLQVVKREFQSPISKPGVPINWPTAIQKELRVNQLVVRGSVYRNNGANHGEKRSPPGRWRCLRHVPAGRFESPEPERASVRRVSSITR